MRVAGIEINEAQVRRWGFTLVNGDVHLIICMKPRLDVKGAPSETYHFIKHDSEECYPLNEYVFYQNEFKIAGQVLDYNDIIQFGEDWEDGWTYMTIYFKNGTQRTFKKQDNVIYDNLNFRDYIECQTKVANGNIHNE